MPSHSNSTWVPPSGLCNHGGELIGPDTAFRWGPPEEIGDLLSANSNISVTKEPSRFRPWLIALGVSLLTYILMGEVMPRMIQGKGDPQVIRYIGIGTGLLFGLMSLAFTHPTPPECTYVGTEGAAKFSGKWGRQEPVVCEVMRYENAGVLFSSATHMYRNLIYEKTYFSFNWHVGQDEPAILSTGGEHKLKDRLPPSDHIYHFGNRAEEAWNQALLAQFGTSIGEQEAIEFPCRKSPIQAVRLHRDRIEFVYENRVESVDLQDLSRADAKRGTLRFDQQDASWFGDKGKFRIAYENLGNAKLFLFYLSQLLDTDT